MKDWFQVDQKTEIYRVHVECAVVLGTRDWRIFDDTRTLVVYYCCTSWVDVDHVTTQRLRELGMCLLDQ